MLANFHSNGIWESESVNGGWRCASPDFPPGGDCTFFFRWGNFDYIIGGFKDLWSKPADAPDSKYESLVAQGLDFGVQPGVSHFLRVLHDDAHGQ